MPNESAQTGFSLVEALVALALTALTVTALLSAVPVVQRGLNAAALAAEAAEERLALRATVAIVERARASRLQRFSNAESARAATLPMEGGATSMRFTAEFAGNSGYGGIYTVSITVAAHRDGEAVQLLMRRSRASELEDVPEPVRVVIERARSIALSYANAPAGGDQQWRDSWMEPDRLPYAVRLTVVPFATPAVVQVATRLEMRR